MLAGNEASDGRTGAVPAMVAELLGVPALTHATRADRGGFDGHRAPGDR